MIRPGHQDTLVVEGKEWMGVTIASLYLADAKPAIREELAAHYGNGLNGAMFENDEVPVVMDSLVSVGALNSQHVVSVPAIRERSNSRWFAIQRAHFLKISDAATTMLVECASHPGFSGSELELSYAGIISRLEARRPITKFFGNRR